MEKNVSEMGAWSSLVDVMVYYLFGVKPLPKPMLTHRQSYPEEEVENLMAFES